MTTSMTPDEACSALIVLARDGDPSVARTATESDLIPVIAGDPRSAYRAMKDGIGAHRDLIAAVAGDATWAHATMRDVTGPHPALVAALSRRPHTNPAGQ